MPQKHPSKAFNTLLKKKMLCGAVTVMTAGSLLGFGAVGAQAAPLDQVTDTTNGTSGTTSTSSDGTASTTDDVIAAVKQQLRADITQGSSAGEKAQNVSTTIAGQTEVFASLPENLQTDLTSLNAASGAERDALAAQIGETALDGGYGEDAQNVAMAVQDDPRHPLSAALSALVGPAGDQADPADDVDRSAEKTSQRVTEALIEHPELFANLPAELQADLTELRNLAVNERAAGADAIEAKALAGEYGTEIQNIAGHIRADAGVKTGGNANANANAAADADVSTGK